MADQKADETVDDSDLRKIRPWIAALLTVLGWGVGLYYARRTKAAILMSVASGIAAISLGVAGITYIYMNSPVSLPAGFAINDISDLAYLLLSTPFVIGVWVYVVKSPRLAEKAGPRRLLGYVVIWAAPIAISVAAALVIRFFLVQPFHIAAASMMPTIGQNSYFLVEKSAYGINKHSFAPFDILLPDRRFAEKTPERGDIVVFRNAKDGLNTYVKRLVGLPGEEIRFVGGRLHINGVPVAREEVDGTNNGCRYAGSAVTYVETLPNGVFYKTKECDADFGRFDNVGPYTVPPDHYFMLGDNRDQSQDSRVISRVGYIHKDFVIGRVHLSKEKNVEQTNDS